MTLSRREGTAYAPGQSTTHLDDHPRAVLGFSSKSSCRIGTQNSLTHPDVIVGLPHMGMFSTVITRVGDGAMSDFLDGVTVVPEPSEERLGHAFQPNEFAVPPRSSRKRLIIHSSARWSVSLHVDLAMPVSSASSVSEHSRGVS